MIVVGIDPGITGALALFVGGALGEVVDMPVFSTRVDGMELHRLFERWEPDVVYLEEVHAMPKNGSIASFTLGLNTGIVTGVVHAEAIPLRRVAAGVWKTAMGLRGKDKNASRGLAAELYPKFSEQFRRVKDDGRAEAVLIGRYGVYDQIRETNGQDSDPRGSAGDRALPADDGRARHPAGGAGEHQREHQGESGRSEGIAEVRPLVRPSRPQRGEDAR